jgi:hypothetical protein
MLIDGVEELLLSPPQAINSEAEVMQAANFKNVIAIDPFY